LTVAIELLRIALSQRQTLLCPEWGNAAPIAPKAFSCPKFHSVYNPRGLLTMPTVSAISRIFNRRSANTSRGFLSRYPPWWDFCHVILRGSHFRGPSKTDVRPLWNSVKKIVDDRLRRRRVAVHSIQCFVDDHETTQKLLRIAQLSHALNFMQDMTHAVFDVPTVSAISRIFNRRYAYASRGFLSRYPPWCGFLSRYPPW